MKTSLIFFVFVAFITISIVTANDGNEVDSEVSKSGDLKVGSSNTEEIKLSQSPFSFSTLMAMMQPMIRMMQQTFGQVFRGSS